MPPGPSGAPSASPAESPPFSGTRCAKTAVEDGELTCHGEDRVPAGPGQTSEPVSEVKRSVKKKQKDMLARASPVALHLKMQTQEQQQLNGLVSPSEGHQRAGNRPDNLRSSVDNCDGGGGGAAMAARNSNEHCQHEGHSPFSKNGSHSPLIGGSVNGMPDFTRSDEVCEGGKQFGHRPPGNEPPDADRPDGGGEQSPADPRQPLAADLARLDLSSSPARAEGENHGIRYVRYESELQMPWIMRLITKDLSEPYSIYTYRYFIHNWPQLCFLVSST